MKALIDTWWCIKKIHFEIHVCITCAQKLHLVGCFFVVRIVVANLLKQVQPELVDLSDASEEEEEEELLSDLLPQDEATQEYLTRVAEALQQARQQHQELQGKIQRCSQKVKEDELAWKKASQKLCKLAREEKHLAQQIAEVRFRLIQETVQEGPSQKHLMLGKLSCLLFWSFLL